MKSHCPACNQLVKSYTVWEGGSNQGPAVVVFACYGPDDKEQKDPNNFIGWTELLEPPQRPEEGQEIWVRSKVSKYRARHEDNIRVVFPDTRPHTGTWCDIHPDDIRTDPPQGDGHNHR